MFIANKLQFLVHSLLRWHATVGGNETLVNEYPSMAGLVDSTERRIVCGATISEINILLLTSMAAARVSKKKNHVLSFFS